MKRTGRLVVFEGPDGAGKSTLAKALCERLDRAGRPVRLDSFPGKRPGTLGRLVYELHHCPGKFGIDSINPSSLQTLHVAAHVDEIESVLRPAFEQGMSVILDRYWWSTLIYGKLRGAPEDYLRAIVAAELKVWGLIRPDCIFLVERGELPRGGSLPRTQSQLVAEYSELAEHEKKSGKVVRLNNDQSPEATVDYALAHLAGWMPA